MKKVALAAVAVLLGFMVVQPVQAAENKALVIIDSYFDSKVNASNVKCITTKNILCTDIVSVKNSSLSHDINHGNAMTEVAKKQSASTPIILLMPTTPSKNSVSAVNVGHFIDSLNWVNENSSNVGAVSISRYFGNPKSTCAPSNVNTAPYGGLAKADATVRSLISTLKSKNIPVFVSTGNKSGSNVDYPACITDTVSVGTGSLNSSGAVVSVHSFNNDTDYFGDYKIKSFSSPILGLIPNTTSAATVAVAAQYLINGISNSKVVAINQ